MILNLANAFFKKLGYKLSTLPKTKTVDNFSHRTVNPFATYSPWLDDASFLKVATEIKGNTLVDQYRCHELWQLADQAIELDKNASFIEIGVWRGGTAAILSTKIQQKGSNNKLYLADTFQGVPKATNKDFSYTGGEHNDTSIEIVENLLSKTNFKKYNILKGIFPEETAHLIPENDTFSFCHIDVDVYLSAKDIVNWIFKKMIVGGIIVFDDYGFETCTGITKFIEEQRLLNDRIVIHNLNGHALIIKAK